MRIKINGYTIFLSAIYFLVLFTFAPIESIYHYYPFLWSLISIVALAFSYLMPFVVLLIMQKKDFRVKKKSYGLILGAYMLVLIFSTLINDGALEQGLSYILKIISYTLIQYLFLKKNPRLYIDFTLSILWIYAVINLITVLQNPGGMYIGVMSDGSSNSWNWFLGYKNSFLPYYYFAAVLGCAAAIIRKSKRFTIINYIMIVIMEIALIKVDAVTSYVGMVIVVIASLVTGVISELRINISLISMIINGVIFVFLIIMYRVSPFISYIVTFFKRDLTFSNRRIIWDRAIDGIQDKLWFGHGYQIGSDVAQVIGMQHPHNMYLWQLYRGGILLGLLFAILLYVSLQQSEKSKYSKLGKFFVLALSIMMVMWQFEAFGDNILIFGLLYLCFNTDRLGSLEQGGQIK